MVVYRVRYWSPLWSWTISSLVAKRPYPLTTCFIVGRTCVGCSSDGGTGVTDSQGCISPVFLCCCFLAVSSSSITSLSPKVAGTGSSLKILRLDFILFLLNKFSARPYIFPKAPPPNADHGVTVHTELCKADFIEASGLHAPANTGWSFPLILMQVGLGNYFSMRKSGQVMPKTHISSWCERLFEICCDGCTWSRLKNRGGGW